jgi:hypothetical protein
MTPHVLPLAPKRCLRPCCVAMALPAAPLALLLMSLPPLPDFLLQMSTNKMSTFLM